jgi:hypothetical protein
VLMVAIKASLAAAGNATRIGAEHLRHPSVRST